LAIAAWTVARLIVVTDLGSGPKLPDPGFDALVELFAREALADGRSGVGERGRVGATSEFGVVRGTTASSPMRTWDRKRKAT
jgi:hypothetical protein